MTSPKLLAILATALTLCSACGGTPTRTEFVDKVVTDGSKELGSMTSSGISDEALKKILGDFAGCVYDKVKDNADDLDTVVNETDSDKVNALIDQEAPACKESFSTALQDEIAGAAQVGG